MLEGIFSDIINDVDAVHLGSQHVSLMIALEEYRRFTVGREDRSVEVVYAWANLCRTALISQNLGHCRS